MEIFDVHFDSRIPGSKGSISRLKQNGFIPGNLYGPNGSIPVSIPQDPIRRILEKNNDEAILNVNFDGSQITVRVKEVQREPVNGDILHIEFMPISKKELH